jgi:hypothetical protein
MDDVVNVAAPVTFENVFHKWRASTLWRKYAEVHIVIWSLSFELEQSVSVISLKLEGSSHRDQDVKPLWLMTSLVDDQSGSSRHVMLQQCWPHLMR